MTLVISAQTLDKINDIIGTNNLSEDWENLENLKITLYNTEKDFIHFEIVECKDNECVPVFSGDIKNKK